MISQTAEYALRAAVHLAANPDSGPAAAKDIADAVQVPVGYLQKVLRMLCQHDLLIASRGATGGFVLARPAESISVLDVLRAADNPLPRIERCPLGRPCHKQLCPLHKLLDEQMQRAELAFASASIRDLVDRPGNRSGIHGLG